MSAEQDATVHRRVLGRRVRDMRERAGITLLDTAESILAGVGRKPQ
jgi:hypothetical protein